MSDLAFEDLNLTPDGVNGVLSYLHDCKVRREEAKAKPLSIHAVDPTFLVNHPELDPDAAFEAQNLCGLKGGIPLSDPDGDFNFDLQIHVWPHNSRCANGKLGPLAQYLNKSEKTIGRYCESGVISEKYASKTQGGHWKINYSAISNRAFYEIKRAIKTEDSRQSKDDIARRERYEFLNRRTHFARIVELAGKGIVSEDVKTPEQAEELDVAGPIPDGFKLAIEKAKDKSLLFAAAQNLRTLQLPCTVAALAKRFEMSRVKLYSKFGRNMIQAALRVGRGGPALERESGIVRDADGTATSVPVESFDFDEIDRRLSSEE